MSDVNQQDSEDEGLAFGYSAVMAEPVTQPDAKTEDEPALADEAKPAEEQGQQPDTDQQAAGNEEPAPDSDPASQPGDNDPNALVKKLDGRLRNMQGEINKLTAQLTAQTSAAATAAAKEQGADAPTATQVKAAMQDGEKLKALRSEFPEWADALDEQGANIEQRIISKLPSLDGMAKKDDIAEFKRALPVLIKHPTFEDDIRTPEFSSWLDAQPDSVKTLADSEKAADAIALMDKFYERVKAPPATSNQKRLERLVAPPTGGRQPGKALSEDEAMSIGYNRNG